MILSISSIKITIFDSTYFKRISRRKLPKKFTADKDSWSYLSHQLSISHFSFNSKVFINSLIIPAYHCKGVIFAEPISVKSIAAQANSSTSLSRFIV